MLARAKTVKLEKVAWENFSESKELLIEQRRLYREIEAEVKYVLSKAGVDTPGKLVLDIGAGTGYHSKFFNRYVGIDLVIPEKHVHTPLVVASFYNLPFKQESFDLVYVNAVAHHSSHLEDFLDETYRVVKDNGAVLLLCEPFGDLPEQMTGPNIEFNYLTWRYYYGLKQRFMKVKVGTYQRRTYLKLKKNRARSLIDLIDLFSWIPPVFFAITNRCFWFWRHLRRYWILAK